MDLSLDMGYQSFHEDSFSDPIRKQNLMTIQEVETSACAFGEECSHPKKVCPTVYSDEPFEDQESQPIEAAPKKPRRFSRPHLDVQTFRANERPPAFYRDSRRHSEPVLSMKVRTGRHPLSSDHAQVSLERERSNHALTTYVTDNYMHKRGMEMKFHPLACLEKQTEITPAMRSQLIDWLIKLNHNYKFYPDTLFLAVNLMDRFIASVPISKNIYQLVGLTSYLIAGKHEEIYPPEINDLIYFACASSDYGQVLHMEKIMLQTLKFDLSVPTSAYFLEHLTSSQVNEVVLGDCTIEQLRCTRAVARFFLELSLTDYAICQYAPSFIAKAALILADQSLDDFPSMHFDCLQDPDVDLEMRNLVSKLECTVHRSNRPPLDIICQKYWDIYKFEADES
ncbi:unnamed protein product [Owenia fusiformis]|uniref:Cyclin N-terminal domain-containing protein n=1 Tax=Owenia fusiformis TaxID=6347 RepID=A0A8S4NCW7_OWEFU|nr:unnamed protein product [Owenia fusiformis]